MFAIGIEYLMGWSMAAADGAKKEKAEWPPHPERAFSAFANEFFETGQDESERAILQWLETLPPPSISASLAEFRHAHREMLPVVNYVPVNDTRLGREQLPQFRSRQPRRFPVAIPHDPVVYFSWDEDIPAAYRKPLESLCRKVASIGHPASLVQVWVTEKPPPATLIPVRGSAKQRLRVIGPGRLSYLENRCSRQAAILWADLHARLLKTKSREEKRKLKSQLSASFPNGRPEICHPESSLWQGYSEPSPEPLKTLPHSLFDHRLIILSLTGKKLSLPSTLQLTAALRGALLKACPQPIPEWVSGHSQDGSRSESAHIAILPLPFVGYEHADGRVMGLALAIPKHLEASECSPILERWLWDEHGVPRRIRLFDGQWFECTAELDFRESPPRNLQSTTWIGPAREWASVSPIVLDRHFDGRRKWEKATETVKDSCERIGLPRPLEVRLHPVSMLEGVPKSNQFPSLSRKHDGGRMLHMHAIIVFEQKVQGPVVLGAGRFRGYGLCRPLTARGAGI